MEIEMQSFNEWLKKQEQEQQQEPIWGKQGEWTMFKMDRSKLDEKNWIQGAVHKDHEGYCTPMTKKTCTPARKALAKRFKSGDIHQDNVEKE